MKIHTRSTVVSGILFLIATVSMVSAQMSQSGTRGMQSDSESGMKPLSDAQIAHIAVTADEIDIAYAHLALAFSNNAQVRQFAESMIADHTAVNAKAAALAQKLGLSPQSNEVSQQLLAQAKEKMDELSQMRGGAFDRAYLANELAYHEAVNAAVGDMLIPGASNPELKKLLESAVPLFRGHEEHVRRLNEAVSSDM